jgi:hypothetical protein
LVVGVLAVGCDAPQPVVQGNGTAAAAPPAPPPPPGWEPPAPPPAAAETPAAASPSPAGSTTGSRPAALPSETRAGVFAGGLDDLAAGPRTSGSAGSVIAPAPQPQTEIVEAKKGVGLKGRSLDEHEGIVVTPVKALFAAKERAAYDIQVPQALNLYDAANGGPPKTHEEFMEGVIKANNIKLPELPAGHEYWYDPQAKQLMVKRPRTQ